MGRVDGCGHDGQHKCTLYDTRRLCHSILGAPKPVFCRIQQICCFYNSPRCLHVHLQIWRFLCPRQRQRHNQLPLAYALGVIRSCVLYVSMYIIQRYVCSRLYTIVMIIVVVSLCQHLQYWQHVPIEDLEQDQIFIERVCWCVPDQSLCGWNLLDAISIQ